MSGHKVEVRFIIEKMVKSLVVIRVIMTILVVFFFVFYFGLKNNDEIRVILPNGFYKDLVDRVGIISGVKKTPPVAEL